MLFNDAEVISRYTREEALEDGVLVDLSEIAKEAGFKYPLAVTAGVFEVLNDTRVQGQDLNGRAWDMLNILRFAIRASRGGAVLKFAPLFLSPESRQPQPVKMWSQCGPGDDAEPVITVMLEGED